jgi:hypothetical protein
MTAVLMIVAGTVVLAAGIDVVAVIGWLPRRKP